MYEDLGELIDIIEREGWICVPTRDRLREYTLAEIRMIFEKLQNEGWMDFTKLVENWSKEREEWVEILKKRRMGSDMIE